MTMPEEAATVLPTTPLPDRQTVLDVIGMTRTFGGLIAVNDVSFAVTQGEIFGLIGPNGAGKTTLFNLMTGLIPPTSGRLIYRGSDITARKPHQVAASGIARTFQNIRLFGNLSALENVMIAQHVHTHSGVLTGVLGIPPAPAEDRMTRQKALALLDLVGLANRAETRAVNFAYGDQRRLEIARALALEPRVLLLDEPAAGMNPNEKQTLSAFIRSVRDDFKLDDRAHRASCTARDGALRPHRRPELRQTDRARCAHCRTGRPCRDRGISR